MAANDASEMKSPSAGGTQSVIGPSPADDGGGPTEAKQDPLTRQSSEVEGSAPGSQKKGLHVSFPEDKLVSGYMDPPTPWNDASQCSTDELVASYLSACEKLGVKPNARLLSQLQVITNFDDRNETLTLKNENFDAKHCETLEEVFRRVQFRTVDLEATKLEEEGAVTIFDMIEYYESCLKLNISYSKNLGQRGWQACSRMIRKTPCLENLEARGSSLSDFVMPFLGRSLRVGSALTSLHLEFTVTSGKPLQILVAALKVNETLKELYLADNKLMPSDGIQLGSLLKYNRTLHLMDLRNNHLQDTGFLHICEGIWEQGRSSGLNTLVIWNNQLSYQAMNHLSRALMNSTSLETLNLGHNNLTNEGMHRLKESLLKNKSLLRIGLQASKITCEGAVALAEFIAESTTLVRLDLRENEIKTGGLMALCLALKVSESVTRIDLDKEPKKESGVKDYADQQKRLLADISNYMQRNRTLARQREEDEIIAQETDCNSTTSPTATTTAEPDIKTESIPATTETTPRFDETETKAEDEVNGASEKREDDEEEEESFVDRVGGEVSPRHRMSLTLQLRTRCEMLESPDFVPESEMQVASPPPPSEESATSTPTGVRHKRKIPLDIPPSPMVSSHGRTVLVPVFEDPLSPSLDDMAPSGKTCPTKSYDVMASLDTDCIASTVVGDCQASTCDESSVASDPDAATTPKLEESLSMPSSPDGSFSSGSTQSESSPTLLRPVLSRSVSLPGDVPPGRLSHRKSTLKATRPKHRFQVSKTVLPHKPPLGRRGSGSHKTPSPGVMADTPPRFGPSEHSTLGSTTSSPFPMAMPLTTSFQLQTTTMGDCSKRDGWSGLTTMTKTSCDTVSACGSIPTASAPPIEPSLLHTDPLPVDDKTTSEVDSLKADNLAPSFPLDNAVPPHLSANGVLPNSVEVSSADLESLKSATLCKDPVVTSVNPTTFPIDTEDKNVDDFTEEEQSLDFVRTSGASDDEISTTSVPDEDNKEIPGLDVQSSSSQSSEIETGETCRTSHDDANGVQDEPQKTDDDNISCDKTHEVDDALSSDKTLKLSNGLKLGFPQDVIDMAELADDIRKLHLGNAASHSDDHFDAKKSIV